MFTMSNCEYLRVQKKPEREKEEAMNGDWKISKGLKHAQNIKIVHEIKSRIFFFIFNYKQTDKYSPPALEYKSYNGKMTLVK